MGIRTNDPDRTLEAAIAFLGPQYRGRNESSHAYINSAGRLTSTRYVGGYRVHVPRGTKCNEK